MRISKVVAGVLATTILTTFGGPGLAQDVPAFRVPLERVVTGTTMDPVFSWVEQVSECSTTCGTGTRTTTYQCQDVTKFDAGGSFGAPEANALCVSAAGAQPAAKSSVCTVMAGCGYDWVKPPEVVTVVPVGSYPPGRVGCGNVNRTFDPSCRRDDGVVLAKGDHAFCRNDLPDYADVAAGDPDALGYDRTVIETTVCNTGDHEWNVGSWSGSSSTCSATAFKTRPVTCERKFDGTMQADSACVSPKPDSTKVEADYSGCSYSYVTGSWGPYSSTCSATATRNRSVTCRRSDGTNVAENECSSRGVTKPSTSDTSPQYSGCSYSWTQSGWGSWSSTCSSSATRTRTATCRRSDGTNVADSDCTSHGVAKPNTSETSARYEGCSYTWNTSAWGEWDSNCSSAAKRTRTATCRRSDGTNVSDAECTSHGVGKPAVSQTSGIYSGCSYSWETSSWGAWNSNCSASARRTRTAICRRSDGASVSTYDCTSAGLPQPPLSEQSAQYDGCSYSWTTTDWGAWSSTCSSSASRTRVATCRRSNGTVANATECTSRGLARPATSENSEQYGGCSYSWLVGGWSAWTSTCSASASRTRSVKCRRSNGSNVSDSECTSRGSAKPAASETSAVYSGCSYTPSYGSWSACSSGSQSRSVTCRRSDGVNVAQSNCGLPATQTQSCVSYAWASGGWSGWSTCTGTQTRTRSVQCKGSNGSVVADSYCGGGKPASSETQSCTPPYLWSCSYRFGATGPINGSIKLTTCTRRTDGFVILRQAALPWREGTYYGPQYLGAPPSNCSAETVSGDSYVYTCRD